MDSGGAEVDQQGMPMSRGAQISQHLGYVFIGQGLTSLQFDNQAILHEQVGEVITQDRAVFVPNLKRVLRSTFNPVLRRRCANPFS